MPIFGPPNPKTSQHHVPNMMRFSIALLFATTVDVAAYTTIGKADLNALAPSYCDTTGPIANPCCALTSKASQETCVNHCDTADPTIEVCCKETSKDAQAKCRATHGPLTGDHSGGPVYHTGGPTAMDACFKTCDMKERPSCATAHTYSKGCASTCSTVEMAKLFDSAADQPCTGP